MGKGKKEGGHGHSHITSSPDRPTFQVDHGGSKDDFSAGPYPWDPKKPNIIRYWDRPNAVVGFFRNAVDAVRYYMPPTVLIKGRRCTLDQVRVVQRFVTVIYLNGQPVRTVHWTATFEELLTSKPDETDCPVVEILGDFEGSHKPGDVVGDWLKKRR